jgi:hypothetical protein
MKKKKTETTKLKFPGVGVNIKKPPQVTLTPRELYHSTKCAARCAVVSDIILTWETKHT